MQREANMEQSVSSSTTKYPSSKAVNDALAGKQDTISDLDAIRAGALLGSTAYQLPVGGIPFEDLEHSVQVFLEKADNSLQPNPDYDGQLAMFNEDGYVEGAGITPDDLVQKDGTYPDLTAGAVLGAPVPAEFAYRGAPYGGSAVVDTVLGNSVKWNQLADQDLSQAIVPSGHIYYSNINGSASRSTSDGTAIAVSAGDIVSDLTAIFGSGNEPATAADFEAWMAQQGFAGLTDFNPGQVLGNAAKYLKTAGFQLWDEEWENGYWDETDGGIGKPGSNVRCKNFVPVLPNTTYCHYKPVAYPPVILFFDSDKNYLSSTTTSGETLVFTTPAGCAYIKFYESASYGNTYNNDICISISGPRNGQYEPYVGAIDTLALNLSTLTGIPEGGGSSEVVFPLGLQSIGGVSDEIHGTKAIKRFGVVDLGDLTWVSTDQSIGSYRAQVSQMNNAENTIVGICSRYSPSPNTDGSGIYYGTEDKVFVTNAGYGGGGGFFSFIDSSFIGYTEAQVATALSGSMFVYELATPIEYTLDQPLPALYETAEGGPEYIEGPAGTAPTTAPFVGEIRYSQPQADANGLAVAILDALKAASKISSYTFGIDPETSKPAITIS